MIPWNEQPARRCPSWRSAEPPDAQSWQCSRQQARNAAQRL